MYIKISKEVEKQYRKEVEQIINNKDFQKLRTGSAEGRVRSRGLHVQRAHAAAIQTDRHLHGPRPLPYEKQVCAMVCTDLFCLCVFPVRDGYTRWLPVRPKLTAMAASTCSITAPSTRPILSRRRRLSSVRICSSRITESLGRPLPWAARAI